MKIPILINVEAIIRKIRNILIPGYIKAKEERLLYQNNEIYFEGQRVYKSKKIPNANIIITGENNKIYLNKTLSSGKFIINIDGKNNKIQIGENNTITGMIYISFYSACGSKIADGASILIGNNNFFNGNMNFIGPLVNGRKIYIGNDNLFAPNAHFKGVQDHLIYDINTEKQINIEEDIILEDKIWVCEDVLFLNKAHVKSNSVIATRAVVNKNFEKGNVLLAGVPARVKKENIMWNRYLDDRYKKDKAVVSKK